MSEKAEFDKALKKLVDILQAAVVVVTQTASKHILSGNKEKVRMAGALYGSALMKHSFFTLEKSCDMFRLADPAVADEMEALAGIMADHLEVFTGGRGAQSAAKVAERPSAKVSRRNGK